MFTVARISEFQLARARSWRYDRGMQERTVQRRFVRILLIPLGLAATYILTGLPGLLLAVPPGYATAIFVPAGLALSAVLALGAVCLPGVFFGSLVLNVWVGYRIAPDFSALEMANSIVIAVASTLQAGFGALILRRAIGHPALLDQARDLLRFLLLTPALCLTSATISLGGMWALGTIERASLPLSWVTWWIGDTLGVLVILPLMYALFGEPRTVWRQRAPYVAVPMIAFFTLFVVIFVRVRTWEAEQSLIEFRMRSQQVADAVQASMEQQSVFLEQLGAAFQIRRTALTPSGFEELVGRLPQRFPILEAVGWAPWVAAADRSAFESAQRPDRPAFRIRERSAAGTLRPAAERAYFYPVTFLEPLAGKQEAIGLDIASNPQKRAAIEASIAGGEATATAPLHAVQDYNGPTGTILLTYAVQGGPNGPGVIFAVLQIRTFIEKLIASSTTVMTVQFTDVDDSYPLFDNFELTENRPSFKAEFTFGTRRYLLSTQPTTLYVVTHRGLESWAVLAVGVFATGLLGALLLLGSGHTHRTQQLVNEQTFELQVANRRLNAEMVERERVESALRQARHMEAIGQLTGGVAHDFNNLLQVVLGNLELLRHHTSDARADRLLSTAEHAAERGAKLVASLLAFARRQTLRPEIVDANRLIREFSDLIRRALGPTIDFTLNLTSHPCYCRIDTAQFQSAILNIAINARDAMPEGGQLIIESQLIDIDPAGVSSSAKSPPQRHVVIKLRDSGCGMTPDVLDRAFEPFFTTKGIGQGSGLGLSQVYGFVKQSDGHVEFVSAVGAGTEVIIYLPLVKEESGFQVELQVSGAGASVAPATILVVEDDPDIRHLMIENLRALGYTVLSAADGKEAISIIGGSQHIDLLFSDIVLGSGIRGDELGRHARALQKGLKILLTTGYAADQGTGLEGTASVLQKPFRRDELAEAIRVALHR